MTGMAPYAAPRKRKPAPTSAPLKGPPAVPHAPGTSPDDDPLPEVD